MALILGVPCLLFLAFRGWNAHLKRELPRWRSNTGLASILLTLVAWILLLTPFLFLSYFRVHDIPDFLPAAVVLAALLGIPFAFALRGGPRIYALLASLFMVALGSLTMML